ncbi:hypothetical protein D3C80_1875090 [compost metagenome]
MEHIVDIFAGCCQRLLVPDITNTESQTIIFKGPAHGYLGRFASGVYNDLFGLLWEQLLDQLIPPRAGPACD